MNRIVHLGLGAFHRAHQAAVLQRLRDAGDTGWELAAGNLRDDGNGIDAALRAQGGVYTLETVAPDGSRRYQRIESLSTVVPHAEGHANLVRLAADPDTRIVSFTVTEAGYYLDPAGRLDLDNGELAHDLDAWRRGRAGRTVYSVLAAICAARRGTGAGPLTLLSCDNLRHNGGRVRAGLRQFLAHAGDSGLATWVERNTTCPNAMVDRITPRPTAAVRVRVAAVCGWDDAAAVMAEDWLQWVIEDDFAAGRPAWEAVGVRMTADVAPFEEAKIRLLNASHSVIAWAGALAGHRGIHDALRDTRIHAIAHAYLTAHAIPSLPPGPVDLPAYRDSVLARFGNAALDDTVERVAADSAAKFTGFILPTLRQRLDAGVDLRDAAIVPALLLAFLQRTAGKRFDTADPVRTFCADRALWGDVAGNAAMEDAVRAAVARVDAAFAETCP